MLNQEQSLIIWNKLVEQYYPIEKITISADKFSYLEIIFEKKSDLENFRDIIFNLMYVNIMCIDVPQITSSLVLTLYINIDLKFLEKIIYPKFTKELNIFCAFDNENIIGKKQMIGLGILPSEMETLLIISSIPFDLTNLPNKLIELNLAGCTGYMKFNLDYLPTSLKILKLANTDDLGGQSIYEIKDFQNLPQSLNEILIGNMFFNSGEDLLQNYQVKKSFQRKKLIILPNIQNI